MHFLLPIAVTQSPPQVLRYGGELTVEYRRAKMYPEKQEAEFTEGVVLRYGPTIVRAKRVLIQYAEGVTTGTAEGDVELVDPDGLIQSDKLVFNWKEQTGHIESARVQTLGLSASAATIDISPTKWELAEVSFTTCQRPLPFYAIGAKRLVVLPGKKATLYRASYSFLGKKLGSLPKQSFSLDTRQTGFKAPLPTYRRDLGFGFRSDGVAVVGKQLGLSGYVSVFKRALPSYSFYLSKSLDPVSTGNGLLAPRSGLAERIPDSYLANVGIDTPELEFERAKRRRKLFSIGFTSNESAIGRDAANAFYTKPFEIEMESSGLLAGNALNLKVRAHQIRRLKSPESRRLEIEGFGMTPVRRIGKLETYLRADYGGNIGKSPFAWGILQGGLSLPVAPFLRLSGGATLGGQSGRELFPSDTLLQPGQIILRTDFVTGPAQFSLMHKYDYRNKRWFDREYQYKQIIGCLEGVLRYRQFSGDFRFGFSLRLDAVANALSARQIDRPLVMTAEPKKK